MINQRAFKRAEVFECSFSIWSDKSFGSGMIKTQSTDRLINDHLFTAIIALAEQRPDAARDVRTPKAQRRMRTMDSRTAQLSSGPGALNMLGALAAAGSGIEPVGGALRGFSVHCRRAGRCRVRNRA
jgi:hypothetical protein